uniref:von Hippel-Lindau disease tumor suppressor-like n=1 Tax=Myxine glutinosa TaxID=7769 RepID=UPI0035900707
MRGLEVCASEGSGPVLLRSGPSMVRSFVVFCNASSRRVRPVWLNYKGEPQSYPDILPHRARAMHTYVGHPWLFRDVVSGDKLLVNGKEVFFPPQGVVEQDGNVRYIPIHITLPVYSLKERCLQVVRVLVPSRDFGRLNIAHTLQEELAETPDLHQEPRGGSAVSHLN